MLNSKGKVGKNSEGKVVPPYENFRGNLAPPWKFSGYAPGGGGGEQMLKSKFCIDWHCFGSRNRMAVSNFYKSKYWMSGGQFTLNFSLKTQF